MKEAPAPSPATASAIPGAEAQLLSGNEAIARGAWEAGVRFGAGYPGTPSTEILEALARMPGVAAQWSVNEKVALECGAGASFGGARALVTMKHVGLNVAADPLMTLGLTGVNGGLVVVSADDPGMASSQNEQDNRNLARLAGVVMLEPSDSQHCLELARRAFQLSEDHDLPVLLRTTTPVNHGKGLVRPGVRQEAALRDVVRDAAKWVMLPAWARARRGEQLRRLALLEAGGHELGLHAAWSGDGGAVGVVAAGAAAAYVREAAPDAPLLELALTHPLPFAAVDAFASRHPHLLVVEELDPYLEDALRLRGLHVTGKEYLPRTGALGVAVVRRAWELARRDLGQRTVVAQAVRSSPVAPEAAPPFDPARIPTGDRLAMADVPGRPPVLCPACPYRGVLRGLRREEALVFGDIGCSTLGALLPHETIHFTLCMGASVSAAAGYSRVRGEKPVALIGDSTFLHSGITALADAVYNGAQVAVVLLDNDAIAMTGGQGHPGTGLTLSGGRGPGVDYAALGTALGARRVSTVDPYDGDLLRRSLARDLATEGTTILVAKRPCVLVDRQRQSQSAFVHPGMCTGCRACLDEGCPALVLYRNARSEDRVRIDGDLCTGCPDCSQVCEPGAISWYPETMAATSTPSFPRPSPEPPEPTHP